MATPREVLNDVLEEFENVYGYSLYSAIPNSQTSTGRSGTGTTSKDILYAQVEADLLKEITTSLGGKGNSPLAVTQLIMSNIADNIEVSGSAATGKQAAGSTRKGKPTLKISYGRNTGIDAEASAISGVLTSGVTGSLAKRATQTTEGAVEAEGLARRSEVANQPGSGPAPQTGVGITPASTGEDQTLYEQAQTIAGDEGTVVGTKYDNVFKVTARVRDQYGDLQEDASVSGFYQVNDNGELGWSGDRLSDIDVDEVTKYTHGFDLDGKQYRMDNTTGDIEVKEALSGQFGFPGQREWRSGTIRMTERPEEKPIDWITYTDSQGVTWQQDANDPTNRTKISDARQNVGTVTRFNDDTQQYETFRVDLDTGQTVGDSLGQGFDVFESNRNFQLDSDRLGESSRQFNVTDARLRDEFNRTFGEDVRQFDMRFGEDVRQFDLGFGEDQRQFNLGFGETQRQFDTTEGRMERTLAANNYFNSLEELGRNYRTFVQTSPQLANAATNQGELIRNILTNGGDVLARTYFTRGGISPLPEITQADLINNLNDEMQKIQTFEQQGIQAENARRARADMERARGEYEQFAEFQRQTPQFTTRQIFDEAGFGAAQTAYQQSLGDMDNEAKAADEAALTAHTAAGPASYQQAAVNALTGGDETDQAAIVTAVEQGNTAYANETARLQGQVASHTTMGPDRAQFTETIREQIPVPTFQSWAQSQGPSFAPTPLLNVPDVPTPQRTNQAQLIAQSRATTPPAVASVLSGQMPTPLQFGGLPLPTFQQLQALTPTEQDMLNSRLMTEFNVPLSDVAFQSQRQFGEPSMERNRDLARFRGYAV